MAIKAGEPFHAHAVDHTIRMAIRTCLLVRLKLVQITEMALAAADVLHKNMPGMPVGAAQGL